MQARSSVLVPRAALVLSACVLPTAGSVSQAQTPAAQARQGTGTVSGAVVGAQGEPLVGATVRLADTRLAATTDTRGRFTLARVPAGTYRVTAAYIGYSPVNQQVRVSSGAAANVTLRLTAAAVRLGAVEVLGTLSRGQAAALQQQKAAANIQNVVAAEQIRRFPDRSAGEAMQRLPGVSVVREEGEAEQIQVRGIAPALNAVTINGQRVATSGGGRTPNLIGIQADLVRQITLTKALLPEQDGDAIGGTIDFRLAEAPERPLTRLDAQLGYNNPPDILNSYGRQNRRGSLALGRRFVDQKFGALVSGSAQERNSNLETPEWRYLTSNGTATDTVATSRSYGDRDKRIQRAGATSSFDYAFSPDHRLHLVGTANWFQRELLRRSYTRGRGTLRNGAFTTSQDLATNWNDRNEQKNYMAEFGGEHRTRRAVLDYSASWSQGVGDEPRTFIDFARSTPQLAALSDATWTQMGWDQPVANAAPYALTRIEERRNTNRETVRNAQINLRLPFQIGTGEQSNIKVGVKSLWRDKLTDRTTGLRAPVPNQAPVIPFGSFSPYAGVNFRDDGYASIWANTVRRDSALARVVSYFDGDERIPAGYAQASVNWTSRLNTLVGARVERTTTTLRSLSNPDPGSGRYTTWLPAFHTTYRFGRNTQLRFAATTGLGRPSMRDQSPYEDFGTDVSNPTINRGNPALRPQTSKNLDLLFETYSSGIGVISAGVYRKDIRSQFISQRFADSDTVNGLVYDVVQRVNGTGARIDGLEFAFQQNFSRWPVPRFLRPFGLLANFTLAKSTQTLGQDTTLRTIPVSGTPRRTGNLGLTYDNPRVGLTTTLSGNYVSALVETTGNNRYLDVWNDEELYVGLSLTQRLRGNALFYFEMNNLGNQGENSYFGEPGRPYARYRSRDFYGREFSAGIRYNY